MLRYSLYFSLVGIIILGLSILVAEDKHDGAELYQSYCATCHGMSLSGGNARSLNDGKWQFGSEWEEIFENISTGLEDYGMPGFAESLSEDQIESIMDFISDQTAQFKSKKPDTENIIETTVYKIGLQTWISDLEIPWALDFIDKSTALVTERPGNLRLVINGILMKEPIANTPIVLHKGQGGLMDVAIDPDYDQNKWIYLAYSHAMDPKDDDSPAMTRIVRGRIENNTWIDQQNLYQAKSGHYFSTRHHYGCRIVFDKKGYLYFSVGDRGRRKKAQDISLPNGKIHRIYRDGSIPESNPFLKSKGAVPSIFCYGNRNPQGLAVHPQTDQLWETEHGPLGGDELNLIKSGINYGWPVITYGKNYNGTIITPYKKKEGMEQPILHWTPSIAVCGLDFYSGDQFPEWQNDLLVGALKYEEVRLVSLEDNRVIHDEVILKNYGRVRDVTCGPDGAIYVVLNEPDQILKLTNSDGH